MGEKLSEIRQAAPGDKEQILAISAQIWDGDDYLPRVVDQWLVEETGEFSVALLGDRVVGFSKLSEIVPGYGWLQGARVDVTIQGRGIGRALTQHHIELAGKLGIATLAMATDSDNTASRTLAERMGFFLAGEYFRFQAEPLSPVQVSIPPQFRGLPPRPANGIVPVGWTFYPWHEELMETWVREGKLYGTQDAGFAMMQGNRPERVNITLLWGPPAGVADLLAFTRKQPEGVERINCVVWDDKYNQVLMDAGYQSLDEHTVVVYQYNL
jgi:RimJ/RimL family protein N-acetyltransferase